MANVIDRVKKEWEISQRIDHITCPSRMARYLLYMLTVIGFLLCLFGLVSSSNVSDLYVTGSLMIMFSAAFWLIRASRYVRDKEYLDRED